MKIRLTISFLGGWGGEKKRVPENGSLRKHSKITKKLVILYNPFVEYFIRSKMYYYYYYYFISYS